MDDDQRFWRVYKQEWCVVYISDTEGHDGMVECQQRYGTSYRGRVRPDEWRLGPWSLMAPELWPWGLELFLPVMKGEYVSRPSALDRAHKIEGVVVLEGSKADRRLLNYGRRMLREDSVDADTGDSPG